MDAQGTRSRQSNGGPTPSANLRQCSVTSLPRLLDLLKREPLAAVRTVAVAIHFAVRFFVKPHDVDNPDKMKVFKLPVSLGRMFANTHLVSDMLA